MKANKLFYKTRAWQACRKAYAVYRNELCETCLANGIYKKGEIVHHKVHLNADNITDPNITLSWDNLILVCRDCHAKEHGSGKRYKVDEFGRVLLR